MLRRWLGSEVPEGRRTPIVAFAPDPWEGRRLNRQQILARLAARRWPIFYSNGAFWLWERGTAEWKSAHWRGEYRDIEGVNVYRRGVIFPRWQPFSDQYAVRHHVRSLLGTAGRRAEDSICYIWHPAFAPYAWAARWAHVVYHAYDSFKDQEHWTEDLAVAEEELLSRADLVVATAREMVSCPRARELANGADVTLFMTPQPVPPDMTTIPRPRLLYAGAINAKVDLEMVLRVAGERPDWHWVFVGQSFLDGPLESPDYRSAAELWRLCRQRQNIHYLGQKPYEQVPGYMQAADVNVMCYRENGGWWRQGYPLKMHEQLAVGRPVVAAPLPTICQFAHVVDLADTPAAWIAAISRALCGGVRTPEERRLVAAQNSWDQRIDQLEAWLLGLESPAPEVGSRGGLEEDGHYARSRP